MNATWTCSIPRAPSHSGAVRESARLYRELGRSKSSIAPLMARGSALGRRRLRARHNGTNTEEGGSFPPPSNQCCTDYEWLPGTQTALCKHTSRSAASAAPRGRAKVLCKHSTTSFKSGAPRDRGKVLCKHRSIQPRAVLLATGRRYCANTVGLHLRAVSLAGAPCRLRSASKRDEC